MRVLNKNRIFMRDNISDVHSILDHLLGGEIIRNEQQESILAERTPTDRKRRMIDILVKCAPKSRMFETFCYALGEEGFAHVRDTLKSDFDKFKVATPTTQAQQPVSDFERSSSTQVLSSKMCYLSFL